VLPPAPAGFVSLILAAFTRRSFPLLWRGSHDGFGAGDFYGGRARLGRRGVGIATRRLVQVMEGGSERCRADGEFRSEFPFYTEESAQFSISICAEG
jgi:hypothetical protein